MPTALQPNAAERRWQVRSADPAAVERLARAHGLSRVTATLLALRGHDTPESAQAHLMAPLSGLHDPALLPDMPAAARRVARAIARGETILVHGDYDVDGVTGTVLLVRLLRAVGADVRWHIPDRFTDGYSFGAHSLAKAAETGAKLVISVDNGTSAVETIGELAARGVDVVVTDHHEPPHGALPRAVAIVNPKLPCSNYPFRDLCGGAVAFKLAWAVCQELTGAARVKEELRELLVESMGYVAIATVCDVVPLVGENRILARHGLRVLETSKRPGPRALLAICGLDGRELLTEDVGFQIGPRINAAGRLANAGLAVELLLADDAARAAGLAKQIDELNTRRKGIGAEILAAAESAAAPWLDRARHPVLVVSGQGWHQGVVGIVAARLVQKFGRPSIVIGLDGAVGRGSARSVPGFSVLAAMDGGAAHVVKHGGHEQAAGLEIEAASIDDFREAVCARAGELLGGNALPEPARWVDCDLPFAAVTPDLQKELDRLQPYGERNERPVFRSADLRLAEPPRTMGRDGTHLSLQLRSGAQVLKAVGFGMASRVDELAMGAALEVVYTSGWNQWKGERHFQLQLVDFRRA